VILVAFFEFTASCSLDKFTTQNLSQTKTSSNLEVQLIETMNSKRRSSARTKQQTSLPRPSGSQPSVPLSSVPSRPFETEAAMDVPAMEATDLPQSIELAQAMGLASQLLTALNHLTAQLQEQSQQQQQFHSTLAQVLQTVPRSTISPRGSNSVAKRNTAIAKGSFTEFESKDLRKSHAKGSAEEKLRRAFGAIVAYNETAGRNLSEKWAINQNALAELTGCNRPAIKQFLSQYGSEIEAHHQLNQLLPRHNYSHGKNGIKITNVIQW
jgi:hypothetical protein